MSQIIAKRKQELGETTKQSCVAMTINVLKSLRADTKVAKEKEKTDLHITDVSDQFYPSFKKIGGKAKRVLRSGKNGNVIMNSKVKWKCQKYFKGQKVYTFKVVDIIASDKKYEYLVVAEDSKIVREYAKKRHKNRIKKHKTLAKFALGMAMHKVHERQNATEQVNEQTKSIGMNNTYADIRERGFNSGDINIHVEDNLRYATDALKTGSSDVDISIQKALNKMVGYLNHQLHQKGIYDDLKIPFEDLQK